MPSPWPTVRLGEVLRRVERGETPEPGRPKDRAFGGVP
jgi:hypothetical protein